MFVRSALFALSISVSSVCFAQRYNVLSKWTYLPLNKGFWTAFDRKMAKGEWYDALRLTLIQEKRTRDLEKAEVNYAQILVLKKMNQNVLAYHRALDLMELAPGSMPALGALRVVDQLAQEEDHEMSDVKRIINSGVFKEVPEDIMPLVSYLVAYDYRERKFPEWTAKAEQNIVDKSFWGVYFRAQDFVLNLPENVTDAELAKWQTLREQAANYPRLNRIMQLQEARFLHKLRRFDKAEELYSSLKLEGRDYGRVLFERSWTLYSLKQYSMALGLLQTLKSGSQRAAIDPESYMLAMVAYRDLCHYPAVRILSKEFFKIFGPTLDVVRSGNNLEQDPILIRMVTQKDPWKISANEISDLKKQAQALKEVMNEKTKAGAKPFFAAASADQEKLETVLIQRLNRVAGKEYKQEASRLLTLAEQVKLLEYIADLDEYRLRKVGEERVYKSEQAQSNGADGLFWNVDGEFWKDEVGTYRVLVSDRCNMEPKESR